MKKIKLLFFSVLLLIALTACSSEEFPWDNVDTSGYSVNEEDLKNVSEIASDTYDYETIHLNFYLHDKMSFAGSIEETMEMLPSEFYISKNPKMGVSMYYANNAKGETFLQTTNIYIEDLEVFGGVHAMGDEFGYEQYADKERITQRLFEVDEYQDFPTWYKLFEELIEIVSNPEYVVNTTNNGNVYTITASPSYVEMADNRELQSLNDTYEVNNFVKDDYYTDHEKSISSRENHSITYHLTIENGVITNLAKDEYYSDANNPVVYNLYVVDILEFNDNENIQNIIQDIYDTAIKE